MKLLASDFDNTLLFNGQLKNKDVETIKTFQNNGHLFGVCTGRSLSGITIPSKPYQLNYDFYILMSGATILNKDKEVIYERKIPITLINEIYTFLNYQDASVVYQDQMYKVYQTEKTDFQGIYLNTFDDLNTEDVSAFSFHYRLDEIAEATKATKILKDHFGDVIEVYQNNQHIDLAAKGCSKGHGMKIIQDYFQLSEDDIYAIGDSWNDLPMLDSVKHGFSFPFAHPDVQLHAEKLVNSVAECIQDIENTIDY